MKKIIRVAALSGAVALALAACGSAPDDESGSTGGSDATASDFKACMVSDEGGFEDKSFNQSGSEGLDRAGDELSVEVVKVESSAATDYAPNVDNLVSQDCNLIIGVGFNLADAMSESAAANPDIEYALVDSGFNEELDNAKPLLFNTQEAAFLAGYVAAGTSTTGTVATFGGMQLPSVSIFMDGYVDGVAKYNEETAAPSRSSAGTRRPRRAPSPVTSRTRPTARTWPRASSTRARTSSCPSPARSASVPPPPRRRPAASPSSVWTPTGSRPLPSTPPSS